MKYQTEAGIIEAISISELEEIMEGSFAAWAAEQDPNNEIEAAELAASIKERFMASVTLAE